MGTGDGDTAGLFPEIPPTAPHEVHKVRDEATHPSKPLSRRRDKERDAENDGSQGNDNSEPG